MLRPVFLLILLLIAAAPVSGQQSQVQRCEAMQNSGDAATREYCLGIFAASGHREPRDMTAAMQHYEKAAEMGNADAQAVMGVAYEHGTNVTKNLELAVKWYQKAVAQGHAGAQLNLGQLYAKGEGVPRDAAKARQLIEAAARQGLAPAQRALAELQHGAQKPPGDDLWKQAKARYQGGDKAGAAQLVLKAAQAGHPEAMYEMGYLYEHGDGVAKNIKEAGRWYRAGAEAGDTKAQASFGTMYENGQGVAENWVAAAQWYRKSAEQDNRVGQYMLGRAYQFGVGVPLSLQDALTWYDKASAQGDGQGAYFAKYIRDNHGLDGSQRDEEEQAIMGPLIKRTYPRAPPTGAVFHNKAERLAYVRAVAADNSRLAQQLAHDTQVREYDDCRRAGRDSCHQPVTAAPK
jgi:TPR repeat protein